MEEHDPPGLRLGVGKVVGEPRELFLAARRGDERRFRIERDEMNGPEVEAVEPLGVVWIRGAGAIAGQCEQRPVGRRRSRPLIVIADRWKDGDPALVLPRAGIR